MGISTIKKLLAGGVAVISLAAGLLVVTAVSPLGLAGAQEVSPQPTEAQPTLTAVSATSEATSIESTTADDSADDDGSCDGRQSRLGKSSRHGIRASALTTLAEALDMDRDSLVETLRNGQTVAQLAGGRADDVIAALVQDWTDRIEAKVADGALDQDQADEMIAGLEEKATDLVNGERPGRTKKFRGDRRGGKRHLAS
ncbi:hypothetical protein [Candidatus Poriferisocius sp.]|uniref:hypothetical protein n=1 Tax=Candidatus Poriferisocius sp. TaxID=3101276 RepID=UPI003B017E6B